MVRFHPVKDPQEIAQMVAKHAKAMAEVLFWLIVAAASLAGTYVAARIILVAAKTILKAVGI